MGIKKLDFDAALLGDGKTSICLKADQIQELADLLRKEAVSWVDLGGKKVISGKLTVVTSIVGITLKKGD